MFYNTTFRFPPIEWASTVLSERIANPMIVGVQHGTGSNHLVNICSIPAVLNLWEATPLRGEGCQISLSQGLPNNNGNHR